MDRFTWGITIGAVLLVVLSISAVLLVQRDPAPADLTRPEGVLRAYVEALDNERPEEAWDLLAPRVQAGISRDEFIQRASETFRWQRGGRTAIDSVTIDGASARVDLTRTYSGGGGGPFGLFGPSTYTTRFSARLEQEQNRWRITVPPDEYLIRPEPRAVVITTPVPAPTATPPGAAVTPAPIRTP